MVERITVDNEYNDLDNAISDLSQMHVSYLNRNMMKQSLTNGKILLTQDQIPMFFPDAADMITSVLIWATVMLYSSPPLIFILYSMTLPLYI